MKGEFANPLELLRSIFSRVRGRHGDVNPLVVPLEERHHGHSLEEWNEKYDNPFSVRSNPCSM